LLDKKNKVLPLAGYLLRQITKEALPLEVKGSIQYIINRNQDGWVVTLLNNRGVYKEMMTKELVVEEDRSKVQVYYPGKVKKVLEWRRDKELKWTKQGDKAKIELTVPAGEVRVVAIKM